MKIQKVTLIGLGAMGAFFAPRLEALLGNENFQVLADGDRGQRLQIRGVTINGVNHWFSLVSPQTQGDPADLIIMAVKDTGLAQAIKDIRHQVGPQTIILSVMNGIDSEERLAAAYGWEHVLYSYMRVSIVMKDGVANFDPSFGKVHFGEARNGVPSEKVLAVKELFDAAGIPYAIDADMVKGMWFKFMCNVGENLTCALLGIPFGAYRLSDHANAIRRAAMWEVVHIANRRGIDLGAADIERQEEQIQRLPFANKPSTLQDLENGRKTEIEMFAGKVVALGQELGVETPLSWMFYQGIRVLEQKNEGMFRETK